jgi:hypothetical protein
MISAVRPHTKLAAALMAAGVFATTPAVVGAGPEPTPVLSNIAVRHASFVTDALYAGGDVVSAVTNAVEIAVDLAVGMNYYWDDSDYGAGVPVNPISLAAAALQNPGSALSYLAQLLLNPSDNYSYYTYPWYFKAHVLQQLVSALPAALSVPIDDAIDNIADSINTFFAANLPDSTPTTDFLGQAYGGQPGWSVYAVQNALAVPTQLLSALTYYVAYLPANLEATVESAIQTPADIPGLVSNLIYSTFSPDYFQGNTLEQGGLLGNLTWIVTKPFLGLPAPISDLANNIYAGFTSAVSNLLSNLPTPLVPTPFPSAAAAASATPTATAAMVKDAAATEDSSSADQTSANEQTAETPKAHAPVRPSRKAVTPERNSAKQSHAGKADGGSTGGKGGSARPGKARDAA